MSHTQPPWKPANRRVEWVSGGLCAAPQAVKQRPHEGSLEAQMKVAIQILKEIPIEALFFFSEHLPCPYITLVSDSCSCLFQLHLRLSDREEGVLGQPWWASPGHTGLTGLEKTHTAWGTRLASELRKESQNRCPGGYPGVKDTLKRPYFTCPSWVTLDEGEILFSFITTY